MMKLKYDFLSDLRGLSDFRTNKKISLKIPINSLHLLEKLSPMRRLYTITFFLVLICLTSCVDVVEHYDFKADGSCKVAYTFDMSKAVSVLMNLMSDSVRATPQFAVVKDTSLNFYSALPDTTQQKMTADEVSLA